MNPTLLPEPKLENPTPPAPSIEVKLYPDLRSAFAEVQRVQRLFEDQPAATRGQQRMKRALEKCLDELKLHARALQQGPQPPAQAEVNATLVVPVPTQEQVNAVLTHVRNRK